MDTELSLTHERIDDIPLIIGMAERIGLREVLDRHVGRHWNLQGYSYGWLATAWIAYILSEGDHRKSTVEEWSTKRKELLERLVGEPMRSAEFSDDRLGNLLRRLSDEGTWQAIEADLWTASVTVCALECKQVRIDSTTSYGYHRGDEDGLMQLGHSKDHRPDLRQLKIMAAVAEPAGQVLACDVRSGNTADDPLYEPIVIRARQIVGQGGLLYVGDAKMAAKATRAAIVAGGDHFLTRLPRSACTREIDGWIRGALAKRKRLTPIDGREGAFGRGYEIVREQKHGATTWSERVIIYYSDALTARRKHGLDERLARATADLEAITPAPGRGRRHCYSIRALVAAVHRIKKAHDVDGLLTIQWRHDPAPSRADPDRHRYVVTQVVRKESRIADAVARLGWQVLVTDVLAAELSLADAVTNYNGGHVIESQFHDIKGRPLGIQPLNVARDDQIIGLTHLLTLALRLLSLIASQVRAGIQASGDGLRNLIEGQPARVLDRPTGRRIIRAFYRAQVTRTHIRSPGTDLWHVTSLPDHLAPILAYLGLPHDLYTRLASAPVSAAS